MENRLSRRTLLTRSAKIAAAAAVTAVAGSRPALAQFPPPEVLADPRFTVVTTTESAPWQSGKALKPTFRWDMLDLNLDPAQSISGPMEGFGACFNELGWTALSALKPEDREAVLHELFHPSEGARFTYCRMPIGANDFSTGAYSYDETDGDFALDHFSIDHDRQTLVPFIRAAQRQQPHLRLWASPWTPPSWMKRNHFYAEAPGRYGMKDNGIRPDQVGEEGQDFFLQEPRYFEAYARYFGKFIDAYRAEGISIGAVMPQNEFNSAQNFPSCTWTAEGLARFLRYLGPEMHKRDVAVFFGTLERGNPRLLETVMADPKVARYIQGVGVQWAGKNALPAIAREYPSLTVFQSEQECGDGKNSWSYASYCWQLMKHYLRNGARGWMYWNIALDQNSLSTWGWPQNALVTVDTAARTYRYNHDYYLLKHLTHFVEVGAKSIATKGTCDDAIAFVNPDSSVVALVRNQQSQAQIVQISLAGTSLALELAPDSVTTVSIKPA